nr:ABC transporter permease [Lactobacillus johnsonii]
MTTLKAEFHRELIIYRRYLFSSVSDLVLTILMFMGIFWGSNLISAGIIGSSLSALIVGFTLWTTIQNTCSMLGNNVMGNAKSGVLQQLYLMPISSKRLFFNKGIVNVIVSLLQSVVVCLVLMVLTGQWIHFAPIIILPGLLSLVTLFGLGYLIVSVVLKFKRVGSFLAICQYFYLGVLLTQFENAPSLIKNIANLLPLVPMVSWIRMAINGIQYNVAYYLIFSITNAIFWIIVGSIVFNRVDRNIKQNGTLSFF